jgi:hypothetical protein
MVKASGLNQLKADAMFTKGWKPAGAKNYISILHIEKRVITSLPVGYM